VIRERCTPRGTDDAGSRPSRSTSPGPIDLKALLFALVSSRYERRWLIASRDETFSAWTEIFGDLATVTATALRLVHREPEEVLTRERNT